MKGNTQSLPFPLLPDVGMRQFSSCLTWVGVRDTVVDSVPPVSWLTELNVWESICVACDDISSVTVVIVPCNVVSLDEADIFSTSVEDTLLPIVPVDVDKIVIIPVFTTGMPDVADAKVPVCADALLSDVCLLKSNLVELLSDDVSLVKSNVDALLKTGMSDAVEAKVPVCVDSLLSDVWLLKSNLDELLPDNVWLVKSNVDALLTTGMSDVTDAKVPVCADTLLLDVWLIKSNLGELLSDDVSLVKSNVDVLLTTGMSDAVEANLPVCADTLLSDVWLLMSNLDELLPDDVWLIESDVDVLLSEGIWLLEGNVFVVTELSDTPVLLVPVNNALSDVTGDSVVSSKSVNCVETAVIKLGVDGEIFMPCVLKSGLAEAVLIVAVWLSCVSDTVMDVPVASVLVCCVASETVTSLVDCEVVLVWQPWSAISNKKYMHHN